MLNHNNKISIASTINKYGIFIIFVAVFAIMSIFAPNFFNAYNLNSVLKGMCMNAMIAIGFTIVMITGQLDLSIGSTSTLGAMFVIGFQPHFGWIGSLAIAILAGAVVGMLNGILVAKAKIHSFIVTLGTMTIVQGVIFVYSKGAALNVNDFSVGDWMEHPILALFSPRILITILFVVLFELFLSYTRYGKGFFMVGGNKETAWLAGLNVDRYLIVAFTISGITASLGGSFFAMALSSANPTMGVSSIMQVIAATIIGGTSMKGGKGGVFRSMVAVLTLVLLYSGLSAFGAGFEIQIFASGLVLALVVLYESINLYQKDRIRGQRPELLKELKGGIK